MSSQNSASKLSRNELIVLLVLGCVQFTHIMDFMILMPLGEELMRLFQITPQQFGFIVSVYLFAAGAMGFISAFFIDRYDRKKSLVFCYLGFMLGTLACAFAPNYEFLLAARALTGAFGGTLSALLFSIIGDLVAPEKRGRAMGIVMASFSMASVLGVPFGLFLANLMSWHAPFVFIVGVALVNLVLVVVYIPPVNRHLSGEHKALKPIPLLMAIVSDLNQRRALIFTFLLMFSQFLLIPFVSPSMISNVGFTQKELPLIYFFGGGMTIFTSPFVGRLSDRIGKLKVFTASALMILLPYYLVTNMGPSSLAWALAVTTVFFVLSNGRMVPAMAMVTSAVRPETRGGFMSINSSVQSLGSGSAAMVAGFIVERSADGRLLHYDVVGYLAIGLSLFAIWMSRKIVSVS